jgi:ABC-type Fe3+/spermidine/putrescine transport system ATPase subunit
MGKDLDKSKRDGEKGEALLMLRNLSRRFGETEAVRSLNLDIHAGDFFAILGPSGCGKTTLLRMIGGFIEPSSGSIWIGGRDVTRLGPERRPTNMVFQGYGLFPHMNVRQNIAYGLRIARRPRPEVDRRVEAAIALVRLEQFADRPTSELSGGQQQRVALARALIMRPPVLLLDEPLAALDLKLRQAMQEELRRIHREIGGTFVFVTHDQGEALNLANRIAVMEGGALVQVGEPEEIYLRPRSRFVSTFVGEANILAGYRKGGRVTLAGGASFDSAKPDGAVTVVIRPEAMVIADGGTGAEIATAGRLDEIVFCGPFDKYHITLSDGHKIAAHLTDPALRHRLAVGQQVTVGWSPETQVVLDE